MTGFMFRFFNNRFKKLKSRTGVENGIRDREFSQVKINYFSDQKIVKTKLFNYDNLKIENCISQKLESLIDKNEDLNILVRKRIERIYHDNVWIKIGVWNCQRLNKIQTNERYVKLEFIRDTLNENRFDMIYLVDIDDVNNVVNLNGFKKYLEGRNCLFVKSNIVNDFISSKNILYDPYSKLAFVYILPNIADKIYKENIYWLLDNKFTLIGDLNIKSNKFLNNWIKEFDGEDSLQTGFLNGEFVKSVMSFAAPSDHRFISGYIKVNLRHSLNLKTKEISFENTDKIVKDIANGIVPHYEPLVKIDRGFVNLNDRENTINYMIADYLSNNVKKIYKKYNYLWLGNKREPFLGTKIPTCVVNSFKSHYHENLNKIFRDCDLFLDEDDIFFNKLVVKKTKSHAVNNEFISLKNIAVSLNNIWTRDDCDRKLVFNNILKLANLTKKSLNAQTFFLQKNKILKTCNDVRVIVIVPGILKMFESLIFDEVVDYISALFNNDVLYQFGGVRRGSCFAAMQTIRLKIEKLKSDSLIMLDLSKGYDSINFYHLNRFISQYIYDGKVKKLLLNWSYMANNLNMIMNNEKVLKDRGIAMGLSLSPIVFVFYVDCVIKDLNKESLVMYIDDLTIVLDNNKPKFENYNFVNAIIDRMKDFDLIINKKKTKLLSENPGIISEFNNEFEVVTQDKFLGRKLLLSGDGLIIADSRFYNLNGFRVRAVPYWCIFFIKRLIHNSALEAKLRFKSFMWSIRDTATINAIWRNNWAFFKSAMGRYSYVQMSYSIFNIFRYCIDCVDIIKWRLRINNNEDLKEINKEVIDRIRTDGIPQLDFIFDKLEVMWDFATDNEWEFTKVFLDKLWKQFQRKLLENYCEMKKKSHVKIFPYLSQYVQSKIYNHFGSLQKVIFKHMGYKNKLKQLFSIEVIRAVGKFANSVIDKFNNNCLEEFNYENIFKFYNPIEKKYWFVEDLDDKIWEMIYEEECESIWKDVEAILRIDKLLKLKLANVDNWTAKLDHDSINVFVDGSYNIDSGQAGYGGVVDIDGDVIEINGVVPDYDVSKRLKSISGELWGTMEILKLVKNKKINNINLIYDFQGIKNYAYNIWYSTDNFIRNIYIPSINKLKKEININFVQISSHANIAGNDRADLLAKQAVGILHLNGNHVNKNKKLKVEQYDFLRNSYKIMFKVLCVSEMMLLNGNLNQLNPDELFFTMKIKIQAIPDLLDRVYELTQFEDVDPIDNVYYDLYLD